MATAIKVENVSKAYQLGQIGTGTLSNDLKRWYARVRGKEDPFLKIGEVNDRTVKGKSNVVWSLKDINFEVEQGDAVGIIGKNGAGKSTLLKILSRVTTPTTGTISGRGRVASLLEVGTGFHPELSGKDNIYLNGAILGMRKKEIKKKFDEIVDFAGIERYIDTPVKRYSSGMYVRLAFAVAAYLESEILIVDEVLAVGDAEFQKKCLGKMNEVSKGEGRTVLFVSHNMAAIKNFCNKAVLIDKGRISFSGSVGEGIKRYLESNDQKNLQKELELITERSGTKKVIFSSFHLENENEECVESVLTGNNTYLVFTLKVIDKSIKNIDIGFSLYNMYEEMQTYLYSGYQQKYFIPDDNKENYLIVKCLLKDFPFSRGRLAVRGRIVAEGEESDWPKVNLGFIDIFDGDFFKTGKVAEIDSPFLIKGLWK